MSKYYDKYIPTEVYVVYSGRYSGKTYREFKRLEAKIKELREENKKLKETIKELSLPKEITIKGLDYLKPSYEVTCKGSEE